MSTIIKNYPVFEKNQVLTNTQLNQLVKYLDQQNRLTRTSLIGLGIVCGLDVLCETTDTLTITKGVGVTSEGFLIQTGDCVATSYRNYIKPSSVSYPPFEDAATHLQDITLYELLTPGDEVVTDLTSSFLSGKIVLLYLECLDKDLKSCLGKSCDELGISRIFTLRKLLIGEADLIKVLGRTKGGKPDAQFVDKFKLPPIVMPRPLFHPSSFESKTYYGMGVNYLKSVLNHFDLITIRLNGTYNTYQPILEDIYGENPFSTSIISGQIKKIVAYIQDFLAFEQAIYGVQYLFDFFKDLTLAYNEFREEAFDLSAVCCPDTTRFPKHLMLGKTCASTGECQTPEYRHEFVASPILNQQQEKLNKVVHLHARLVLMLECFSIARIINQAKLKMKITPSSEKKGNLSQRTIPHYYNSKLDSKFAGLGTLETKWDYENYRKCYPSEYPKQLSYDNHNFRHFDESPITTPLGYDLDQFNFFRIEGILAKPIKEVQSNLLKHKNISNLSFDIKAVYFGHLAKKRKQLEPNCVYADLQPAYSIWRNKGLLFFNNLVKTNKSVEKVVMSRATIYKSTISGFPFKAASSQEKSATKKSRSNESAGAGMNFEFQNLSKMMTASKAVDFQSAALEMSRLNTNVGSLMSKAEMSNSASFESSRDTSIKGLFNDLNTCLLKLIQTMPVDFKDFKMDEWLKHYKCVMRMYIKIMKFLASEASSLIQMLVIFIILVIMCVLFRLLRFAAIYPYITIRTLYDTVQERIARLEASMKFAQFLKTHPGMEHKAGLAQGQTFVLVYQLQHELEDLKELGKGLQDAFKEKTNELAKDKLLTHKIKFSDTPKPKQILKVLAKMTDIVVADFTVPFICCDDCGNLPHTPLPLDPLATPICGIAQFVSNAKGGDDTLSWDYKTVTIRILNDLYDPAIYKVRLAEEPHFGEYSFVDGIYDPDPTKNAQIFKYEIKEEAIADEMKKYDDFFIIDEFRYEVVNNSKNNEVVGSDLITIFIPVVSITETQTGNVSGTIGMVDDNGNNEVLPGVAIVLKGTTTGVVSDANGLYRMSNIPVGSQTLVAAFIGFVSAEKQINIVTGENTLDFVLQPAYNYGIHYDRMYKAMDIEANSSDANNVKAYYATRMSDYQKAAEKLEKEENSREVTPISKAKASVILYSGEKDISVVKLNNDYNALRNELIESWDEASGKEKEMYKKALENLTGAYINRLAFAQPERLTNTTKETLKETANIFNSREELGMKDTIATWNSNAKGYVAEDYRENINKELKLK